MTDPVQQNTPPNDDTVVVDPAVLAPPVVQSSPQDPDVPEDGGSDGAAQDQSSGIQFGDPAGAPPTDLLGQDFGSADPSATPDPAAAGGDKKKNPLDVLEELLSQANEVVDEASGKIDPAEEAKKKEEEEQRKEFERKQAEQDALDQAMIAAQREALYEDRTQGSIAQARVQQDLEKQEQQDAQKQSEDGFEIPQLGHTKI